MTAPVDFKPASGEIYVQYRHSSLTNVDVYCVLGSCGEFEDYELKILRNMKETQVNELHDRISRIRVEFEATIQDVSRQELEIHFQQFLYDAIEFFGERNAFELEFTLDHIILLENLFDSMHGVQGIKTELCLAIRNALSRL